MTEDEQEAQSRKYADVAMVLRLKNGNFAVFGPNRKLFVITEQNTLDSLFNVEGFWTWCAEQAREYKPARSPAMNLDDIGEIEI